MTIGAGVSVFWTTFALVFFLAAGTILQVSVPPLNELQRKHPVWGLCSQLPQVGAAVAVGVVVASTGPRPADEVGPAE